MSMGPAEDAPGITTDAPSPPLELREVTYADPLRWLSAGWRDFRAAPSIGLFFGACFTLMGWALAWMFAHQPGYLLALCGGFLLLGPFLCLGLYDVSRKLERGERPTLATSVTAWRRNLGALGLYCGVLLVLEMLWSRSALVVIAVSFNTIPKATSTWALLTDPANLGFMAVFLVVGAVFATLIYATSVVSIPMLLDRAEDEKSDGIAAGLTSIRATIANPPVMMFWGATIAAVVFASMLPAFLGLLVAGPILGHASWHAYRHIVVPPAGPSDGNSTV